MNALLLWILISILLFTCPGPSFWYTCLSDLSITEYGFLNDISQNVQVFLISIEEESQLKQLSTHFVLMTGCSFFASKWMMLKLFSNVVNKWKIMLLSLIFILFFSTVIEFIQTLLPMSFTRGWSNNDIIFSILGGILGNIIFFFSLKVKADLQKEIF